MRPAIRKNIICLFLISQLFLLNSTIGYAQFTCNSYNSCNPPPYPEGTACMNSVFAVNPFCCNVEFDMSCQMDLLNSCSDGNDCTLDNCSSSPFMLGASGNCTTKPVIFGNDGPPNDGVCLALCPTYNNPRILTMAEASACPQSAGTQVNGAPPGANPPTSTDGCLVEIFLFDGICCTCDWDACCNSVFFDLTSATGANTVYSACGYQNTTVGYPCNDGDPNTIDRCDPTIGCTNTPMNAGGSCCALVSISATNTTICPGDVTTLTVTSAGTPTAYQWDNGAGTAVAVNVNPTTTTTYMVTVTDMSGCNSTGQITINVSPLPDIVASASPATLCLGDVSNLTGTSSVGISFDWDNGIGINPNPMVSPTVTTTYTVTVTDFNNCTNTDQVTVTVVPPPTVTASATNTTICIGDMTTLNATGGVMYQWDNGAGMGASVNVSPTNTTTYTVTVTDANNCTNTDQVTINVTPLPTAMTSATSTDICLGDATTLNATGGTTYQWDNGAGTGTSVSVSPTITTTYTVTVTDANNCTDTAPITIIVNPLPTAAASATSTTICTGDMTTLNATGGVMYQWDNGAGTGASVSVSPTITTTYTVTVTDGKNCRATDQVTVTVNPLPTVMASATNMTICMGDVTTLNATGSGTMYQWDNGAGTGTSVNVTPTTTTTYTVTITDANNCMATDKVTITVNNCTAVVALKVFLEGAYTGSGMMHTMLNADLPNTQPFSAMPWSYNDMGLETNVTVPANAVDWVLVELRDPMAVNTFIERHAAFVLDNGDVVDVNGMTAGVNFTTPMNGDTYYVVVRSRNHLDVLSATQITVMSNSANYDFTTAVTQAQGKQQMKDISGIAVLYAGDVDANGVITLDDYNELEDQLSNLPMLGNYNTGDITLDATITVGDFNMYQPNAAIIGVPEIRY